MALKKDGSLVSWGDDVVGQVSKTPTGNDFTAIGAASATLAAIKRDGSLVAWGSDLDGEVSNVPAGNGFVAVSGGYFGFVAIKEDRTAPVIDITAPENGANYLLGQRVYAAYSCADEQGGSGLKSCVGDVSNGAAIDTGTVGPKSFTVRAEDNAGNVATMTIHYGVVYDFAGFFEPIDNTDANGQYILNVVKAGSAIPVKFSLHGNQGLAIFASEYPRSQAIACDPTAETAGIEETVTAGSSALTYDATADQYVYVWKTDKSWRGCRQLVVTFTDGTSHRADFSFTR
jgi:hypothetical protein